MCFLYSSPNRNFKLEFEWEDGRTWHPSIRIFLFTHFILIILYIFWYLACDTRKRSTIKKYFPLLPASYLHPNLFFSIFTFLLTFSFCKKSKSSLPRVFMLMMPPPLTKFCPHPKKINVFQNRINSRKKKGGFLGVVHFRPYCSTEEDEHTAVVNERTRKRVHNELPFLFSLLRSIHASMRVLHSYFVGIGV